MKFYKETEPRKIPKDWKIERLAHLVKYVKGKKPKKLYKDKINADYLPYLTAGYMRGLEEPKWCDPKENPDIIRVHVDDVIMIWDGSYAGHVFTGFEGALASTMVKIIPTKDLDKKFLYYYLTMNFQKFRTTTVGTGIPHVNKKIFEEFPIPLPPSDEQRRIAKVLSTVDNVIEDVDKAVARLEGLKRALMSELLTGRIRVKEENGKIIFYRETEFQETEIGKIPREWRVVSIKDSFELYRGTTPSTKNNKYWGGSVPFVTPTDITAINDLNKIYLTKTEKYLTKEGVQSRNLCIIPAGSLLFTSRATIGYLAINSVEVTINQGVIALIPKRNDVNVLFYYYYLTNIKGRFEELSGGSTYKEI